MKFFKREETLLQDLFSLRRRKFAPSSTRAAGLNQALGLTCRTKFTSNESQVVVVYCEIISADKKGERN